MKKRKILAGLLAVSAVMGLAACGEKDPVDPAPEVLEYTVTFNSNGGSTVASIKVDANGKITLPAAPTKAGYTFAGWYTDSATTKAFSASTAITANITLYAKWTEVAAQDPDADKIKIADAEDFIDMLKGGLEEASDTKTLVEHYILTADIDLTDIDLGAELGSTAMAFSGILDGRGYKISNLNLVRQKKQVGLFEGIYAGTIKNINFENVSVSNAPQDAEGNRDTSDSRGVSLFGNYAAGGAIFQNIAIDGFKVRTDAESTKVEESAGFVVNCFDTVYLQNIAITGMDVELGKNSGAVLGSMRITTDTLKVAGAEVSDKTACVVEAENILLEGNIKGVTSDSQGMGGLIGRCDNFEDGQEINVNGFVFKGTIEGTKNNGPLVGNVKQTGTVVNVSNAYALAGGIEAYSGGTLQGTANVFIGQFKAEEYTFENCYYVDRLYNTQKVKEDGSTNSLGYLDPEIAAPIKASEITEITDAFTVADGKITLNGLSIEIPTDVTVADVAASTVTVNGAAVTPADGVINITGEIPYWHAASASGAAGNFVELKLVAAEGVATTGSYYVMGTTASYENEDEITVYIPVAALAEGQTAYEDTVVTVRWNNAAKDEVYTVKFASDITFEDAPVYGAISQDTTGLTASNPVTGEGEAAVTNNYALNYTAGEIAYDNDGNYVTVKVAQPTWAADANNPTVANATLVSCVDGVATIKVKVAASGANFTVQWTATTDAQAYTITLGSDVTLQAPDLNAPVVTTYELDGAALYTELELTGTKNLEETMTKNGFTLAPEIRIKSDSLSGNKYPTDYANNKGYISFEVVGTGVLTITTANADRPVYLYKIVDNAMTEAGLIGSMSDTANPVKEHTFSNLAAGKYAITFNGLNPTLTDGKLAVEAKIKTLKLVDTVAPSAPAVQPIEKSILNTELAPTSGATERTHDLAASEIDSFFTIVSGTTLQKYCDSAITKVNSIQFDKNEAIQFTVDQKVTVTLSVSSTGGSNCSLVSLTDAAGTVQTQTSALPVTTTGLVSVLGSSNLEVTYTIEAGTYTLSFVSGTDDSTNAGGEINRGGRLASILVKTYVAA